MFLPRHELTNTANIPIISHTLYDLSQNTPSFHLDAGEIFMLYDCLIFQAPPAHSTHYSFLTQTEKKVILIAEIFPLSDVQALGT